MSILGDAISRRRRAHDSAAEAFGVTPSTAPQPPADSASGSGGAGKAASASSQAGASPPAAPPVDGRSELRHRRDALAETVTELHWDLGGLAYEMAIRDHFRLDVLVRRAAVLQERDAELAEVERLLRLEDSASAGSCPGCGAPHSRGAVFCWQCGATLMQRTQSGATASGSVVDGEREATTAAMDALLVSDGGNSGEPGPHGARRPPFSEE